MLRHAQTKLKRLDPGRVCQKAAGDGFSVCAWRRIPKPGSLVASVFEDL